jgi:HEAT repeat protein
MKKNDIRKDKIMKRWTGILIVCVAAILFFSFTQKTIAASSDAGNLKALIVTGQMNRYHNWKVSSPILKRLLEETNLFKVDFAEAPADANNIAGFKPDFSTYNVVVLDYDGPSWPQETMAAFVEYVKNGGGVVVYHSSDNAFPGWKEYNELIGLGGWGERDEKSGPMVRWKDGKVVFDTSPGKAGSHPPKHEFQVVIRDKEHPINSGLPKKWMHASDELYGQLRGPAKNLTVLATAYSDPAQKGGTGENEPVLFTINYGKGRVFHTVLGHVGMDDTSEVAALNCVGFITTFQRGAEWAATGKVTQNAPADFPTETEVHVRKATGAKEKTLDEILKQAAAYDYGQSREALTELTDVIQRAYSSPEQLKEIEKSLLEFLQSDATLASKQFVCKQLSIIGTQDAVPVLAAMLSDANQADMARYALERINGEAVDAALLEALSQTTGKTRVGIINTVGMCKDPKSAVAIGSLIDDADSETAGAAASALGRIGTDDAAAILAQAKDKTTGGLHAAVLDAYLACADRFLAQGEKTKAVAIYKELYSSGEAATIRSAALRGMVAAEPDESVQTIVEVLGGSDDALKPAAIALVRQLGGTKTTETIAAQMPNLSSQGQVQLLSALADRADSAALPVVIDAVSSADESIRIAALKALGSLGDANSVAVLAQAAAKTSGQEQDAARESLYKLRGPDVDKVILKAIAASESPVKVELIKSINPRNITGSETILLDTAKDPDREVRFESIKAIGEMGHPNYVMQLRGLLTDAQSEGELKAIEQAMVSVSRKSPDKNTDSLLAMVDSVKDTKVRCSLLRVLGELGDSRSLDVLRDSLRDRDQEVQTAAIRAMADWPDDGPSPDLLKIAKTSNSEIQRALALRGYVRLIGLVSSRPAGETVKLYKQAMGLAVGANEKKLVLSGLAKVGAVESLEMAADYLGDKALHEEAQAAIVKIAESTYASHPQRTKELLQKVLESTKSETIRATAQELLEKVK